MSRGIVAGILEQFESKQYTPFFLFQFEDAGSKYRYTSLDVPIVITDPAKIAGTYQPRGFNFGTVTYSLSTIVDNVTFSLDNNDDVLTPIFVEGTSQGEDAYLYVGVYDDSTAVIGVVNLFEGQIDGWELDEGEVKITITTEMSKWIQRTNALYSSSCRWKKFKGTECQYAGAENWCDRSYSRCLALGNTNHFGGFRWLPDFENRELWWGRKEGK